MPQFMIKLDELQALIQETPDANRILLTIDTPNVTNGKTKINMAIKVRVVNFLDSGQTDSILSDARTSALSLDARAAREIGVCPYPPGC